MQEWARQDRASEDLRLAQNAFRGPQAQGFIQEWLLLLPLPRDPRQRGEQVLDQQQHPSEAQLRPRSGERVSVGGQELVWRPYHSPAAVLDFNAVLGQVTEWSVAYAVCYLESDRARNDLWLQVGSDDESKVYVNGTAIYQSRLAHWLFCLDTIRVELKPGINVLLFKVVNEGGDWEGCVRLVNAEGRPAEDIRVKLTPGP
jgi:hypothetical protein